VFGRNKLSRLVAPWLNPVGSCGLFKNMLYKSMNWDVLAPTSGASSVSAMTGMALSSAL